MCGQKSLVTIRSLEVERDALSVEVEALRTDASKAMHNWLNHEAQIDELQEECFALRAEVERLDIEMAGRDGEQAAMASALGLSADAKPPECSKASGALRARVERLKGALEEIADLENQYPRYHEFAQACPCCLASDALDALALVPKGGDEPTVRCVLCGSTGRVFSASGADVFTRNGPEIPCPGCSGGDDGR